MCRPGKCKVAVLVSNIRVLRNNFRSTPLHVAIESFGAMRIIAKENMSKTLGPSGVEWNLRLLFRVLKNLPEHTHLQIKHKIKQAFMCVM